MDVRMATSWRLPKCPQGVKEPTDCYIWHLTLITTDWSLEDTGGYATFSLPERAITVRRQAQAPT
jgi:hypothetical protein